MYYLPIRIDNRRIHICELALLTGNSPILPEPVFGFLFKSATLFNTDADDENVLICDRGKAVTLSGKKVNMREGDQKDGRRVFYFDIVDEQNEIQPPEQFPFVMDPDSSFCNHGYIVSFAEREIQRWNDSFIICIRYFKEDGDVYAYSFKGDRADLVHTVNVAIDFGSEASQIRDGGQDTAPMNILSVMRTRYFSDIYTTEGKDDFWQSDTNFFKSVYFMHREPHETHFGEKPNANADNTFIRPLVSNYEQNDFYSNYLQLPNLKLLDLMNPEVAANVGGNSTVTMPKGSDIAGAGDPHATHLGRPSFRNDVLRSILGQFLNCAIDGTPRPNVNGKVFLRIIMMVPNVYSQEKVFNIIEGLYKDYAIINTEKFDGVEVSVISESDASFLGVMMTDYERKIQDAPGFVDGYFLIVDSGKGTTDFSIMTPVNGSTSNWNSVFRGGLPAAGQALTFAVYDAMYSFFLRVRNVNLDDLIRQNKELVSMRSFMKALDDMKVKMRQGGIGEVDDNQVLIGEETLSTLESVTRVIQSMAANNCTVRDTLRYLEKKSNLLSDIVVKEIKNFVEKHSRKKQCPKRKIQFQKVILTGRAFMLKSYKEIFINKLIETGLLENQEDIITYDSDVDLKRICLNGAVSLGRSYHVNNDSELICRPIVEGEKRKKRLLNFGSNKHVSKNNITSERSDERFMFCGDDTNGYDTIVVKHNFRCSDLHEVEHIYYVGRNFLCVKDDDTAEFIDFGGQHFDTNVNNLILETLFPYHIMDVNHDQLKDVEHEQIPNSPCSTQTESVDIAYTNESGLSSSDSSHMGNDEDF